MIKIIKKFIVYLSKKMKLPICHILQVPACRVCSLSQSSPPPLQLVFPEMLHMTGKYFSQIPLQCPHLGWTHIVENRHYNLLQSPFAFHDFFQLFETPARSSIVSRKYYNSDPTSRLPSLNLSRYHSLSQSLCHL